MTIDDKYQPITFEVIGNPAAQGSKRHVGGGRMIEMAAGHKPWRDAVAHAARQIADNLDAPLDGPLRLDVEFRFPMPTSRNKATREAGRAPKVSAPDADKLIRCVGDALQAAGLIRDDARITEIHALKFEVIGWTGATITIGRADCHAPEAA